MSRFVVGISGASGLRLAHLAVSELARLGHTVELVLSRHAPLTIAQEMGEEFASPLKFYESFPPEYRERIHLHQIYDFTASIASGSCQHDGCLIIPCSMSTLAAIAIGLADNLIRRAADVTLKEKRKLVLVPREAPFSEIHLENMLKLARMGACIIPPQPAWYMNPKTMEEMEYFMLSRILDQLGVDLNVKRWC